MFRSFDHHQGAVCSDDDRMIETCRSIFKSFGANNLSVCALVGVPIK